MNRSRLLKWNFSIPSGARRPILLNVQTSFGEIVVRGARLHNLKNLTLSIPHNKLTVITGVSGSGKSSLAFDTIYAEGQRRYVESLSAYARQFLERMEKPAVDEIDGIAPAIAIRQKNSTRNPRSTVATSTEIYDFMRLLWARAGRTFCPVCGRRVEKDTVDQVAQRMLAAARGRTFSRPVPREARGRARSRRSSSPNCARAASTGSGRTARSSSSPRPNRCSISIGTSLSTFSPTASRSRPISISASSIRSKSVIANRAMPSSTTPAPASASCSASASCASTTTWSSANPSRFSSASTARPARVRAARASATPSTTRST